MGYRTPEGVSRYRGLILCIMDGCAIPIRYASLRTSVSRSTQEVYTPPVFLVAMFRWITRHLSYLHAHHVDPSFSVRPVYWYKASGSTCTAPTAIRQAPLLSPMVHGKSQAAVLRAAMRSVSNGDSAEVSRLFTELPLYYRSSPLCASHSQTQQSENLPRQDCDAR